MTACGNGSSSADKAILVYKSTGTLTCGPDLTTQANLDASVLALKATGVTVTSASCGNTGNPTPAVCGV